MDISLPILSLVDLCIKYGNELISRYKSYKDADSEIKESTLYIRGQWLRLRYQLEFLRSIWDSLNEDYKTYQESVLQVLYGKLQKSISSIDSVVRDSNDQPSTSGILRQGQPRRLKYALRVKKDLLKSIEDLKEWREMFDPTWFLLIRLSSKEIDAKLADVAAVENEHDSTSTLKALREVVLSELHPDRQFDAPSIFLPGDSIHVQKSAIPYSRAQLWEVQGPRRYLIVDENAMNSSSSNLSDIRTLARTLAKAQPFMFGVLRCEAVFKYASEEGIKCYFAYKIPHCLQKPRSLRETLLLSSEHRSLNEQFDFAKQLAKSVMFVHSTDFIHKNIRPETIMVLESTDETIIRWLFLIGFEKFRPAGGRTELHGDELWEENLYRHPNRQGIHPETDYQMQHDIYSLGVCLLEIGMRLSFVLWTAGDSRPSAHETVATVLNSVTKGTRLRALELKACLVSLAQEHLPSKMGIKYTDIVTMCLTCLDKTGNSFGKETEFQDEDGIQIGVRYIEKVLVALQEINL